jgi:uncharacterized protein YukE
LPPAPDLVTNMAQPLRPSPPALSKVGQAIRANRDALIEQWARALARRHAEVPYIHRNTLVRQHALLVDIVTELSGPLRHTIVELWYTASDAYGRMAHTRGLATGEVVEEFQHLRELLIRALSETVTSMSPRQSMATVLRLNRLIDKGTAHAVVGYTDALVETLFNERGLPVVATEPGHDEVIERLEQLEAELREVRLRNHS